MSKKDLVSELCEIQKVPASEKLKIEKLIQKKDYELKEAQEKIKELKGQNESLEERANFLTGLKDSGKSRVWKKPVRVKSGKACAVMLCSDIHAEEIVEPAEVNGLNEYNLDIADQSIKNTFERYLLLLEDARNLANIRHGVLWIGGDVVSAFIHDELRERNALAPLPACRWVKERLRSGIELLLDQADLDELTIVTSYGNHPRDTKKAIAPGREPIATSKICTILSGTRLPDTKT